MRTWLSLVLAVSSAATWLACSGRGPLGPEGAGVSLEVAPLRLPGIDRACFDVAVANADGDPVWSRGDPDTDAPVDTGTLCSDVYGNGAGGDITYVGPCDASRPDHDVTLYVDSLWANATTKLDDAEWENPCPLPGGCTLGFTCVENEDVSVVFNLTIMRNADQGFFDIGVQFEDVFCSAKLDCTYDQDGNVPINLLFDPETGLRGQTAVIALACSGGAGADGNTTLHFSEARFRCADAAKFIARASTCLGQDDDTTAYGFSGGFSESFFASGGAEGFSEFGGYVWHEAAGSFSRIPFADMLDTSTYNATAWSAPTLSMPLPSNSQGDPDTHQAAGDFLGAEGGSPLESVAIALYSRPDGGAWNATWHLEAVLPRVLPVVSLSVVDPVTFDIWGSSVFASPDEQSARHVVYPYSGSMAPGNFTASNATYTVGIELDRPSDQCRLWLPVGGVRPGVCEEVDGATTRTVSHLWRVTDTSEIVRDNGPATELPHASIADFAKYRETDAVAASDRFGVLDFDGTGSDPLGVAATLFYETNATEVYGVKTLIYTLDGDGNWADTLPVANNATNATVLFDHAIMTAGPGGANPTPMATGTLEGSGRGAVFRFEHIQDGNLTYWDYFDKADVIGTDHAFMTGTAQPGPDRLVVAQYLDGGAPQLIAGSLAAAHSSAGAHRFEAALLPNPGIDLNLVALEDTTFKKDGDTVVVLVPLVASADPAQSGTRVGVALWRLDPTNYPPSDLGFVVAFAKILAATYLVPLTIAFPQPGESAGAWLRVFDSTRWVGGWQQRPDERWRDYASQCPGILAASEGVSLNRDIERGFVFDISPVVNANQDPSDADELSMPDSIHARLNDVRTEFLDFDHAKGNVWHAGNPDSNTSDPLWQYAETYGDELLTCGGGSCNKRYFTAAFGFDPSADNCALYFDATASGAETVFENGTTPSDTAYPVIHMAVELTGPTGGLVCTRNPIGSCGVYAAYTPFDAPTRFCFSYAGGSVIDHCDGGHADYSSDGVGGTCAAAGPSDNPPPPPPELPACAEGEAIFGFSPVALQDVVGWVPMGALGPPGHTFPTDHQYLYLQNPDDFPNPPISVPVVAPADITITSVHRTTFTAGNLTDYGIRFQPCGDVRGDFGHLGTLSAGLLEAAGAIDQNCVDYEPTPGNHVIACESLPFAYEVSAGQGRGTAGDGNSIALDWTLWDRRVTPIVFANPDRFWDAPDDFDIAHIVPASAYFKPSISAAVAAKVGKYDGSVQRTAVPIGGSIDVDVAGTAQGHWFKPGAPYPPESSHLALAPDHITPDTTQAVSIGLSQPNVSGATWGTFAPQASGTFNRDFAQVTSDGSIYCYELANGSDPVLVKLLTATTLRVEVRDEASTCSELEPYAFGANSFDYVR